MLSLFCSISLFQVIPHKSIKESYRTFPCAEILFEHDNGQNRDFRCNIELTADDATIQICAITSIKEVNITEKWICATGQLFKNTSHNNIWIWAFSSSFNSTLHTHSCSLIRAWNILSISCYMVKFTYHTPRPFWLLPGVFSYPI